MRVLPKNTSGTPLRTSGIRRGGGVVHWDTLQGEGQILHFIKHWRTDTVISFTLRINVAWCQWQAGTSRSILTYTEPIPYLEARWLPSCRDALHRFGATIETDNSFVPRPERDDDDRYIMEVAIQSKRFTDKDLRIINYCRLYLHLTTISEMFDANGHSLMDHPSTCQSSGDRANIRFGHDGVHFARWLQHFHHEAAGFFLSDYAVKRTA